eukprot:3828026-Pyramimonas_sp.AAC.1
MPSRRPWRRTPGLGNAPPRPLRCPSRRPQGSCTHVAKAPQRHAAPDDRAVNSAWMAADLR